MLSVRQTVDIWVKHNECSTTPVTTQLPDADPGDGVQVRSEVCPDGTEDTEVIFYGLEGGGHTWPGGYQYLPVWVMGKTAGNVDATRIIWDFFKRHEHH